MPENSDHILFIRLSAMGDVAMTVPVLKAFRQANPGVKMTVLTRPFFIPFFRDIPDLDFITPDFHGRHKGLTGLIRLAKDIRACQVTHVADLHDVLRTKLLRRNLRAYVKKVSVIDKGRAEKRALTRKHRKLRVPLKTTIERYLETILRLGFDCPEPVPETRSPRPLSPELVGITGPKREKWVGVAPFAQHVGKVYPLNMMAEVIGNLSKKYRVFIFGGGEYEREFAEAMEQLYRNVISVIGKADLAEELDLISNLDLMVSMDSAAMHMASLLGVEVISVWGATHPNAGFYGFGQDPGNAVQLDLDCRPCSVYGNKKCMYGDYRCLYRITTGQIVESVENALRQKGR